MTNHRTMAARSCFFYAVLLLCSVSCTSDWWSRGQTASPDTLLSRAAEEYHQNLSRYSAERPGLTGAVSGLPEQLSSWIESEGKDPAAASAVAGKLMAVEDRLSVGSRPAWAELTQQFRVISEGRAGKEQSTLLASRMLFLLANEFSIPSPEGV